MRKIKSSELDLIRCLLIKAQKPIPDGLENIYVNEMHDGDMGSIQLITKPGEQPLPCFDRLSEMQFTDIDAVPISVVLYVDENQNLCELDIWKIDFSPISLFPSCI